MLWDPSKQTQKEMCFCGKSPKIWAVMARCLIPRCPKTSSPSGPSPSRLDYNKSAFFSPYLFVPDMSAAILEDIKPHSSFTALYVHRNHKAY